MEPQVNITPLLSKSIDEAFGVFFSAFTSFPDTDKMEAQNRAHVILTGGPIAACENFFESLKWEPDQAKRIGGYRALMERKDLAIDLRRKYLEAYVNETHNN